MRNIIEKLQNKPDHVKQIVSLFTSLAITGFIALLWALGLVYGGFGLAKNQTIASEADGGAPSPLVVIKNQISDFAKSAGDQTANVGNVAGSNE